MPTVEERLAAVEEQITKLRSYAHRHSYGEQYTLEEEEESARPKLPPSPREPSCNQCGKARSKVKRLVGFAGGFNLCNECIALGQKIVDEES